ncbi:MAG TPA: hypothetical protein VLI04_07720 [Nocardioidaceae bacterium]|nr:hypothetical protein [Nocardioidaceae bacterium]
MQLEADERLTGRESRRYALRGLLSAAALVGLGYWMLWAFFFAVAKCDESCDTPAEADKWQWVGQAFVAGFGLLAGLVGLVLGFTTRTRQSWTLLAISVASLAAWWLIVTSVAA